MQLNKSRNRKKLGFGLVGTGMIAPHHVRAINANKGAQLIGVFSHSVSRGKAFANRFGIKHYPTYSDMLKDKTIDIVDIVTYNHLHAEYAIKAIEHDKHVIVEKPIDIQVKKAERLVRLAKERQKKLSCVSQLRFSAEIIKLKNLIEKNSMGQIFLINISMPYHRGEKYFLESKWRSKKKSAGGGVLLMNAIHVLDILIWLFGPVKEIYGKKRIVRKNLVEVEDCACALLEFKNNILCVISVTNAAIKQMPIKIEIHGSKDSVILENYVLVKKVAKPNIIPQISQLKKKFYQMKNIINTIVKPQKSKWGFYFQIKDMVDAIKEDRELIADGKSGLEVLKVIDRVYHSCESDQ